MTTYDANPAATHNPAAGVVVPVNWLDLINSNFLAIGEAWAAYTPTWSASGVAPAIGNGTLTGAYKKIGSLLFVKIRWVAGSTTTFGTGTYAFSLPGGVTTAGGTEQSLSAKGFDTSSGNNYVLTAFAASGATTVALVADGTGVVADTVPVTWANGDGITITGCIEVA